MNEWHKSTYSDGGGGNCLEAREHSCGTDVRDTQNREAGHLTFGVGEWSALLGTVATQ